jgi:hypothetical protein
MYKHIQPVQITVHARGSRFVGSVRLGANQLYTTDSYSDQDMAYDTAEDWAERNGHTTDRGLAALRTARAEYAATIDAAVKHLSADGRRVLTTEHCTLKAQIDAYMREHLSAPLETATTECRRTREMWT